MKQDAGSTGISMHYTERFFHFFASLCRVRSQVDITGHSGGSSLLPLFLDLTEAQRETGPPPYLRVWMTAPSIPPPRYLNVWIHHWAANRSLDKLCCDHEMNEQIKENQCILNLISLSVLIKHEKIGAVQDHILTRS